MEKLDTQDLLSDINCWLKAFLADRSGKKVSNRTFENYKRILSDFYEYCAQKDNNIGIIGINKPFIVDFLDWKANTAKKFSNTTKRLYFIVIKIFLKYISDNNAESVNLTADLCDITILTPKRLPKGLSAIEIEGLERYLSILCRYRSFLAARNSLLVKLALYAGLRRMELAGITLADIEPIKEEGLHRIRVVGKGDKERYSYIKTELISQELEVVHSNGMTAIAVTKEGKRMQPSEIWRSVSSVLRKAGITRSGVHQLRHTFAQRLVSKDINLVTIKELLGHADIKTTMIYATANEKAKAMAILK